MNDGFVVMFMKDGVIYPVALSEEENQMAQLLLASTISPVRLIKDHPQGTAVNLTEKG